MILFFYWDVSFLKKGRNRVAITIYEKGVKRFQNFRNFIGDVGSVIYKQHCRRMKDVEHYITLWK